MRTKQFAVALLIVAALFFVGFAGRYQIAASQQANSVAVVFRIDRLTGAVESCAPSLAQQNATSQPKWCPPLFAIAEGEAKKAKLRDLGASPGEIAAWEESERQKMAKAGVPRTEIDRYFGNE